jgi:hypothetical protein
MGTTALLTAGAIALGTVLSSAAAPTPAASASSSRTPVAWELRTNGTSTRHVTRPGTFHLMVGGPNVKIVHLHWSHWNSSSARGSGHAYGRDLGGWESLGRVTVVLHDMEGGNMGNQGYQRPFFEKLHLIGGQSIIHYWNWDFGTAVLPAGWE